MEGQSFMGFPKIGLRWPRVTRMLKLAPNEQFVGKEVALEVSCAIWNESNECDVRKPVLQSVCFQGRGDAAAARLEGGQPH